nr:hypothetical protein CFP56_44475 [Quercus suber]
MKYCWPTFRPGLACRTRVMARTNTVIKSVVASCRHSSSTWLDRAVIQLRCTVVATQRMQMSLQRLRTLCSTVVKVRRHLRAATTLIKTPGRLLCSCWPRSWTCFHALAPPPFSLLASDHSDSDHMASARAYDDMTPPPQGPTLPRCECIITKLVQYSEVFSHLRSLALAARCICADHLPCQFIRSHARCVNMYMFCKRAQAASGMPGNQHTLTRNLAPPFVRQWKSRQMQMAHADDALSRASRRTDFLSPHFIFLVFWKASSADLSLHPATNKKSHLEEER